MVSMKPEVLSGFLSRIALHLAGQQALNERMILAIAHASQGLDDNKNLKDLVIENRKRGSELEALIAEMSLALVEAEIDRRKSL